MTSRKIALSLHPTVTETNCGKCWYQRTDSRKDEYGDWEDFYYCIREEFKHPETGKHQSLFAGRLQVCRDSEIDPDIVDCL